MAAKSSKYFLKLLATCGLLAAFATGACTCGGTPIEVLHATPQGQLKSSPAYLEIQFDKAIVNADASSPTARDLDLEISPKVAGDIRFPTPASLSFTFAEEPKPAQRYEVSLDSGLRAADG